MSLIILGLTLWMLVHFVPTLAPDFKVSLINKFSEKVYKGIFSALLVIALIAIVVGWRSTPIEYLYTPLRALRHPAMLLMLVAFILFGSAKGPVRIKRYVRHPQLLSVVVWAVAHLLTNGETRAVLLFSGMGVWALIEMKLINRREGVWLKPEVAGWVREVKVIVISLVVMVVVMFAHAWFTGIPLF